MSNIYKLDHVSKSFQVGEQLVSIIKDVSFSISAQDFVVILGPSGCGKSTLLHIMLGLEPPTKGDVIFMDKDFYQNQDEDSRSDIRKHHIGMVYQQPNWIRSLTVIENIAFPLLLLGQPKKDALTEAEKVLKLVEMDQWANYIPTELSSGQQQRIALARALVTDPEVIIADEPTGNLDYESGQELMRLLADFNTKSKKTILMVTHDLEYLEYAKTAIKMLDGSLVGVYQNGNRKKLIKEIKGKRGSGDSFVSSPKTTAKKNKS